MEKTPEATGTVVKRERVSSQELAKPNLEESKQVNTEGLINNSLERMTKIIGKYSKL